MCIAENLNREIPAEKPTTERLLGEVTWSEEKAKQRTRTILKCIPMEPHHEDDSHATHLPSPLWRRVMGFILVGAVTLSTATTAQSLPWGSKNHHNLAAMWTADTTTSTTTTKSSNNNGVVEVLPASTNEAICVPGGGFSGFWFTMGQLQSMKMPSLSKDYYCYSAGCLCVVAYLADLSVHDMLDVALESSDLWRAGKITRFEVVPYFVDKMIQMILAKQQDDDTEGRCDAATGHSNSTTSVETSNRPEWLQNLRIVTGARKETGWGLDTHVRAPISNVEEDDWTMVLRKMLLQTVWIPVMVGDALFLDDHIDGGFVARHIWHKCDHTIEAVWNWELLSTCFDTNLSKEQALYFWEAGLAHAPSIGLP